MYFWAGLFAFGTVAFSVNRTPLLLVKIGMAACLIGIVVLLMPRFKPHAPRMAERFLPPRYRHAVGADEKVREVLTEAAAQPSVATVDSLSHEDEELLRKIGTGAHAAGRHSGASGRNGR
jgi:UDP-GlcNAc:undecaprenyl-phosphate GlcNAc-1-phosphate transferase